MNGKCIVCDSNLTDSIITLDNMPSKAQHMPSEKELSSDQGIRLMLYQCKKCGLVQFDCDPVDYYRDVIRACGISNKMTELRRNQYTDFIKKFKLDGKKIWEVGCGGGEFLGLLSDYPVEAYGTENNPSLFDIASRSNDVKLGFVDSEYLDERGPFDAFLSFNFLEHQPYPNSMLEGIFRNTSPDAVGLITVPSLEYFIKSSPYYELIRDHIAMYSLSSLQYLLIQNGFEVVESYMFNYDTLTVYVRKRKSMDSNAMIDGREHLESMLDSEILRRCDRGKLAVWGASHQAFTVLSTTKLKDYVKCVVDSAPFKVGLYTPASHIKIISPSEFRNEDISGLVIIAPAYASEIAKNALEIKPSLSFIVSLEGAELRTYHRLKK